MTSNTGFALITGASSGIGAVYADRLAKRGHDLILVARNEERLNALADRITSETGRIVEVVTADLGTRFDLARIEEKLKNDDRITILVNNAGISTDNAFLEAKIDTMSEIIAINIEAPVRLAHAVLPGFVARGEGTIINIGSVVGIVPELLNAVYGGSKAFVLGFSRALHKEFADRGVRIQVVMPGATATEIWERAGSSLELLPPEIVMSATDMVDAALTGLDLGEFATIPALPDSADWEAFEAAREVLLPNLSRAQPALRYRAVEVA